MNRILYFHALIAGSKIHRVRYFFSEEQKKESKALKITCNLNNAACKLKLKDYKQAEKLCTKVASSTLPVSSPYPL